MAEANEPSKFITIQTVKNDGGVTEVIAGKTYRYLNSCLFICVYQYLRYNWDMKGITVTQLRQETKFTPEDLPLMRDVNFSTYDLYGTQYYKEGTTFKRNFDNMLIKRGLQMRIFVVPSRKAYDFDEKQNKVVEKQVRIRDQITLFHNNFGELRSPKGIINVVCNDVHFELIVTPLLGVDYYRKVTTNAIADGQKISNYDPRWEVGKGKLKTDDEIREKKDPAEMKMRVIINTQ